jgi:hypothetical protein
MLVTLVEVVESRSNYSGTSVANKTFSLREISVNPNHVICLREESTMLRRLNEGTLPDGLDNRQRFTKLTLDRGHTGLELVVVGEPSQVKEKLQISARELLRG